MISKMEFDCKLAHESQIKKVAGFTSIKELYEIISRVFSVQINEILFCTLNTHNFRDMDSLLGNYLSIGDFIVVHMCGKTKELNISKTREYLGLTITDNGNGRAFVKKVKINEDIDDEIIQPGDHIASVNNETTIGMRHYEVAKTIREVPLQTNFILKLIEPLYSQKFLDNDREFMRINDRTHHENSKQHQPKMMATDLKNNDQDGANISLLDFAEYNYKNHHNQTQIATNPPPGQQPEGNNLDSLYDDLTNSSLPIDRLLSRGSGNMGHECFDTSSNKSPPIQNSYRLKIEKINSILESFLGINDNTLAIQIYRLAKENKSSPKDFAGAIESSELSVFNFDDEIKTLLWNCALG